MDLEFLNGYFSGQAGTLLKIKNPDTEKVLRAKAGLVTILALNQEYGVSMATKLPEVLGVIKEKITDMEAGLNQPDIII